MIKKHTHNTKAPGLLNIFLIAILLIFLVAACGSNKAMTSPQIYGDNSYSKNAADENQNDSTADKNDREEKADEEFVSELLGDSKDTAKTEPTQIPENKTDRSHKTAQNTTSIEDIFYSTVDIDDSATAVDDAIWRQFDLAEEYHAMGVIANREASWEEAQYYFEKALHILSDLDIETDTSLTPEATKYSELLDNLIADYRVTLRSLGTLTEDVSASVLVERFGNLSSKLRDDTLVVDNSEIEKVTYDIPIVMNDRVKSSIVYFQTVAKSAFEKYLRRSKKYTPMMKKILREHGLPEDLIYLSLVESGYNPHAYSWARAMGLWQFISSTGRLYGLDRSWWYDERKDPIKSTHAAARFLKDLYKEFGSWELAMAAYNGGPGRVRRTIKSQKTIDFWKMKLKRQTMDYVPLIMAAAIIGKNPEKYGFYNIEHEPEVVWDEVKIDKCLELKVVASEIGCSLEELQELNPELLRRYTPPNDKNYILKLPIGKKNQFLAAYDGMPSPKETSWVQHEIRRGETVSAIAKKYGVSQYAIFEANNLSRRSKIYAGKKLIVPVPLDREYSGSSGSKNRNYEASNSVYVVRAGDNLWDISKAFGTSVSALRDLNYLGKTTRIYVGQKLKIPSSATHLASKNTTKSKSSKSSKSYASTGNSSSKSKSSDNKTYKVKSGDTLWEIARRYGTTTTAIKRLNGLGRSSRIYPGQVLNITSNADYVVHTVRRGETLSSIATHYRTSISRIRANNMIDDPDLLQVGKELRIF